MSANTHRCVRFVLLKPIRPFAFAFPPCENRLGAPGAIERFGFVIDAKSLSGCALDGVDRHVHDRRECVSR